MLSYKQVCHILNNKDYSSVESHIIPSFEADDIRITYLRTVSYLIYRIDGYGVNISGRITLAKDNEVKEIALNFRDRLYNTVSKDFIIDIHNSNEALNVEEALMQIIMKYSS